VYELFTRVFLDESQEAKVSWVEQR
jgi:hypothetical protein